MPQRVTRTLRYTCFLRYPLEGGHGIYKLDGFQAYANHLGNQAHDVFGVVGTVRVGADAAVLVLRHLVLVNHPFEGAAIAQAVFKGFGWDAAKRERIVHLQRTVVFRQTHLILDAIGERHRSAAVPAAIWLPARRRRYGRRLHEFERVMFQRFVFDMQPGQFLPGFRESPKVLRERNAR